MYVFLASEGVSAKKGCVNSPYMRFSITILSGRVPDFRLRGGESIPLPMPIYGMGLSTPWSLLVLSSPNPLAHLFSCGAEKSIKISANGNICQV